MSALALDTPPPVPISAAQNATDTSHLRILSICYFVKAGLGAVGLLFTLAWLFFMRTVFTDPSIWDTRTAPPIPEQIFIYYEVMVIVFATMGLVAVIANIVGGTFLRRRRHRIACMVIGGINCLSMPLGTVLGVFTFLVLGRPSVIALFDRGR